MTRVFLGLGSNLGDRCGNLRAAIDLLRRSAVDVDRVSSFYETEPVGPVADQPAFLNCTLSARYGGSAEALLTVTKGVEEQLGRERTVAKGPRTIDLDILYYGDAVIDDPPALSVPHPSIPERRFVLVPMNEIEPGWSHPALGRTQRELLESTADTSGVSLWEGEGE